MPINNKASGGIEHKNKNEIEKRRGLY